MSFKLHSYFFFKNKTIVVSGPTVDFWERVIIEGQLETPLIFREGCADSYLGYVSVIYNITPEIQAAWPPNVPPNLQYAILVGHNSSPEVEHCKFTSNNTGKVE